MKIKQIETFKFSELSDKAKQKALEKLADINVDYEWWQFTYEDAKNIGLKITSFDLDRHQDATGNFIAGALECAHKIEAGHGAECPTYITVKAFLADRDELVALAPRDENGEFEDERELDSALDACEAEFLKSILEDYSIMLQSEYEYQTSEAQIIESIEANDYDFTAEGKLA